MSLDDVSCAPCRKGTPPLSADDAQDYLTGLPGWLLSADGKSIARRFEFKNFAQAWEFVNKVGKMAETENHHPDIAFGWGYAEFRLTTHAINGLHPNDFIMAAKISEAASE